MRRKAAKYLGIVLSLVLIVSVPGLVGCSGDTDDRKTIVLGILDDLTGPASHSITQTIDGMRDYFRMVEEDNLLPGIRLRTITYDTRLDYSRIVPGYVWLQGQGTMIYAMNVSTHAVLLRQRFENDGIPVMVGTAISDTQGSDWMFNYVPGQNYEAETHLQWILQDWDYGERVPKVGLAHVSGYEGGVIMERAIKARHDEDPTRFDMVTASGSMGQSTWAAEIAALSQCDYIIITSMYGPQFASFLREAEQRGYKGEILATVPSFWWAFWDLVKTTVPMQYIDGVVGASAHVYWSDDIAYVDECKERLSQYRPNATDFHLQRSGWLTGQFFGLVITEAIKNAADDVGTENVDSAAMRNALANLNLTIDGWADGAMSFGEEGILQDQFAMYQYVLAEDNWIKVTDWFTPNPLY